MIRILYRSGDGAVDTALDLEAVPAALGDSQGLLWLDCAAESIEVSESVLRDTFGFHPLAIDDALRETHIAKVDDWGEYLYLVLHSVARNEHGPERLQPLEIDLFLGDNYLVTQHDRPVPALDAVWSRCQKDERHLKHGADRLLYLLIDEVVAGFMPIADEIDQEIEELEEAILSDPSPEIVEDIFQLRRRVMLLRRLITPEREVANRLARADLAVVDQAERIYFQDVYDHFIRLHSLLEGMREELSTALEVYLSTINNRMNEAMKTLTVIASLFLPISFLAGFFGMNFFQASQPLGAWTGIPSLAITMAIMLAVPVGMYLWIRSKGWM